MTAGAFVGREPELARLRSVFARTRGGSGGCVVISGEPGIGKSRLAREFSREAKAVGAAVAWGQCYEGPWARPLSPWGEVLAELIAATPPQASDGAILARILPSHVAGADDGELVHLIGGDQRARLFDAATRILLAEAARRPLVVVIDNVQWADPVTFELVQHVAFYAPRSALNLLLLDRTGEPHRSGHVNTFMSWIRLDAGATMLSLEGLDGPAVARMLDGRIDSQVVAKLAAQTSGNPFYVEEIIRQIDSDGPESCDANGLLAIPDSIRLVVERRVQRLSTAAQTLLHHAAVFPNGFDFPVLERMISGPDGVLLDALDECLQANLLEADPNRLERYGFVHAIVRQSLSESWNPSRRVRLHRRAAEAIEAAFSGRIDHASAEIAVQYHHSKSLPGAIRGLPHALRVVEECREECTPEHAVTFLRIARDLSREGALDQQASVLGQLASAEAEIVQVDSSLSTLEEYLATCRDAGVPAHEIAERLGILARSLKYSAYAEEKVWRPVVERALKLVGPDAGQVWARLSLMLDPVEPISRSGIKVGRWLGFDPLVVKILRSTGDDDDAARAVESFDPVTRRETDAYLTRVRGWSSPNAVMYGLTVAANHLQYRHGAFWDACHLWQELAEISERAGAIHWQQQATNQSTYLFIAEGDFDGAAKCEQRSNELAQRLGPGQNPAGHQLEMATCRAMYQGGNWQELAGEWRKLLDDPALGPHDLGTLTGALYAGLAAYCAAQADDMESARHILSLLNPIILQMNPADSNHNGAVAFAAGAIWRLNAAEQAPLYRALANELIEAGVGDYPQTSLHLAFGQMAALMGRQSEAISSYARAREVVADAGQPPLLPIIDLTEAESMLRWGDPGTYRRISELLEKARLRFQEFDMTPWLQDLQVLADSAEERFARKQHLPGHITEREADVLKLIARGMPDRQISDQLFISTRTVNAHVRNMLAKTETGNRVELAMWARANGIVEA